MKTGNDIINKHIGFNNLLLLLCSLIIAKYNFRDINKIYVLSSMYYIIVILQYIFRAIPLKTFIRDAPILKIISWGIIFYLYIKDYSSSSAIIVLCGFLLGISAALTLGLENSYFKAELDKTKEPNKLQNHKRIKDFPYNVISFHPMILGNFILFYGMISDPKFKYKPLAIMHIIFYLCILILEHKDIYSKLAPNTFKVISDDFENKFKKHNKTNINLHMLSIFLSLVGIIGMINNKIPFANDKLFILIITCCIQMIFKYTIDNDIDSLFSLSNLSTLFIFIAIYVVSQIQNKINFTTLLISSIIILKFFVNKYNLLYIIPSSIKLFIK